MPNPQLVEEARQLVDERRQRLHQAAFVWVKALEQLGDKPGDAATLERAGTAHADLDAMALAFAAAQLVYDARIANGI